MLPKRPLIASQTLSRRTLLDWLGKATVLALGTDLMAACTAVHTDGSPLPAPADGGNGRDLAFQPGSGGRPVFEDCY
jgi:hypothetical protein